MSSASCYTNKVRVTYEAKNTKVQYPKNIAHSPGFLYPVLNCNPDFSVLDYVIVKCDKRSKCANIVPEIVIYSGGNAETESPNILSGGNENTESSNILSGGNA